MKTDGRKLSREILEAYRLRAITLRYEQGYTVEKIAKIFDMNYYSVSRWFCKERAEGISALKMRKARGADSKIDSAIEVWLKKALIKPATAYGFSVPLWNSTMVRQLLKKEKGIKVGSVTVWRYLKKLGLTFQQPEKRYVQQDKELVERWLQKEWPDIRDWVKKKQATLYFEDESGIALAPVIGKTWAPKGETPIVEVTGKRAGILAMSAISPSGKMCFRLEDRRVNGEVLIEFLQQILDNHPKRKVVVIMDNAPCHRSKAVQDFVKLQRRLRVHYIPPYSPELNPDEKVWRHLKHVEIKNHFAEDKQQLIKLVLSALRKMQKTPQLTKNFFNQYLT
jgi:transposase